MLLDDGRLSKRASNKIPVLRSDVFVNDLCESCDCGDLSDDCINHSLCMWGGHRDCTAKLVKRQKVWRRIPEVFERVEVRCLLETWWN